MTFDPTSVEVTCVTLPKDHCVQVPWEYIKVCGYCDQLCKISHTTYIHTTYRMSDHIVSFWTKFRRDKNSPVHLEVNHVKSYSRCSWNMHLMNHSYFYKGQKPKYPNYRALCRWKRALWSGISLLYLWRNLINATVSYKKEKKQQQHQQIDCKNSILISISWLQFTQFTLLNFSKKVEKYFIFCK